MLSLTEALHLCFIKKKKHLKNMCSPQLFVSKFFQDAVTNLLSIVLKLTVNDIILR